jgi:Na+-transporting NADH:ubiquinone oxidoreductase subunit F
MILASQTLGTIIITIIAFLIVSLALISVLLFVKQKLSPSGPVMITMVKKKLKLRPEKHY